MKKITSNAFLLAVFLVFSSYSFKGLNEKEDALLKFVMAGLSRNHYQPQKINDQFSDKVFDVYLEKLDPFKRFLTAVDVDILNQYRFKIDDELNDLSYEFFDLSSKIYFSRLQEAETYYQELLSEPFEFSSNEAYETDPDKIKFASNKADLKTNWKKRLKYETLYRLNRKIQAQEKELEKDGSTEQKSVEVLENEAREEVQKNYSDFFSRMSKLNVDDIRSIYINSITNIYDPHTEYFPPKDKQDFDIRMAGQFEGIGARLYEKGGFVTVSEIVVGGPCYKQGDLEVNDVILKVGQGDEDPKNIVGMRVDDAVLLIRGKKGTEVKLTVRKVDGAEQIISITRDVVKLEETYAKSVVLDEDGKSKVGYIYLPSFYGNVQNTPDGRRCAEDVSKEVEKLKAENVDGIILDLRSNGGGYLNEVVEMAGLFIEDGPIVQVRGRYSRPFVYEDKDDKVQYDGSLVVLVNRYSASASEIMAAAIQDYDRGIVIGSENTYGKGTVQTFLPLNRYNPNLPPIGDLKLTIQKYYRVNGGATQKEGVKSDIVLPFSDRYLDFGEKEDEYAIAWDEIEPVSIKNWEQNYSIGDLRAKSAARVAQSEVFRLVEENAKRYKRQQDDTALPLELGSYSQKITAMQEESEKYREVFKEIDSFDVSSLSADLPAITADDNKQEKRNRWIKAIRKDPYIYEAFQVINDMK